MKTKWKEMNRKEKGLTVAYLIICCVALVFAILDFAELWAFANVGWIFSIAIMCIVESMQSWEDNRKMAVTELVCGIAMTVFGIVSLIFNFS